MVLLPSQVQLDPNPNSPRQTQHSPFLSLPAELVQEIVSYSNPPTLRALAATSYYLSLYRDRPTSLEFKSEPRTSTFLDLILSYPSISSTVLDLVIEGTPTPNHLERQPPNPDWVVDTAPRPTQAFGLSHLSSALACDVLEQCQSLQSVSITVLPADVEDQISLFGVLSELPALDSLTLGCDSSPLLLAAIVKIFESPLNGKLTGLRVNIKAVDSPSGPSSFPTFPPRRLSISLALRDEWIPEPLARAVFATLDALSILTSTTPEPTSIVPLRALCLLPPTLLRLTLHTYFPAHSLLSHIAPLLPQLEFFSIYGKPLQTSASILLIPSTTSDLDLHLDADLAPETPAIVAAITKRIREGSLTELSELVLRGAVEVSRGLKSRSRSRWSWRRLASRRGSILFGTRRRKKKKKKRSWRARETFLMMRTTSSGAMRGRRRSTSTKIRCVWFFAASSSLLTLSFPAGVGGLMRRTVGEPAPRTTRDSERG